MSASDKGKLLGLEGNCAQQYFIALRGIPIAWKGITRKPIPDGWKTIGVRNSGKNQKNYSASHPFQAMTNYAYAVLESQLRIETARIGLDQATGFLHSLMPDHPALILDLLEPLRPVVDSLVLMFMQKRTFEPADFTLSSEGICRLHPQLARRLVTEIGVIDGIQPMLVGLLNQLNYNPPHFRRHVSIARQAQKEQLRKSEFLKAQND